jgi:acyl carrier protein
MAGELVRYDGTERDPRGQISARLERRQTGMQAELLFQTCSLKTFAGGAPNGVDCRLCNSLQPVQDSGNFSGTFLGNAPSTHPQTFTQDLNEISHMPDKLTALFADVLMVDVNSLNDRSGPETVVEWDSVAAMSLVAAIEDSFDVSLSTGEIVAMRSIGLARKVLRRKGVVDV